MDKLITTAAHLLLKIDSDDITVFESDPPFLHTTKGCFEICIATTEGQKVFVDMFATPNRIIETDFYIVFFPQKRRPRESDEYGNFVLVKNDDTFKTEWESVADFAKTIKYKWWLELTKTKNNERQDSKVA
jgi:hypothetical protein